MMNILGCVDIAIFLVIAESFSSDHPSHARLLKSLLAAGYYHDFLVQVLHQPSARTMPAGIIKHLPTSLPPTSPALV